VGGGNEEKLVGSSQITGRNIEDPKRAQVSSHGHGGVPDHNRLEQEPFLVAQPEAASLDLLPAQ